MKMNTHIYSCLNNVSWHCINCGMPQFTSSLFNSCEISSSNSFSWLDVSNEGSGLGVPLATSSPIRQARKIKQKPWEKIQVLIINFQSIKNKKAELLNLQDTYEPSVIMGTETWLNSSVCTSEFFPDDYNVIRKDRQDGYGGVLLAVHNAYTFEHLNTKNNDIELVAAKIKLDQGKSVIVGSAYRPPNSGTEYMDRLCDDISNIQQRHGKNTIWIGGDFNLPDINWHTNIIEGKQNAVTLNTSFVECTRDNGLEQVVLKPTRNKAVLDLFLTNRPSLVEKCTL